MDTIVQFLDDVFRGFPDTFETARAKADLLASMTDRFEALCDDGRSENEALGLVLAEFGSADELAVGLGLVSDAPEVPTAPADISAADAPDTVIQAAGPRSRRRRRWLAAVVGIAVSVLFGMWFLWWPAPVARADAAVVEALVEYQRFMVAVQVEQNAPGGEARRNAREVTDSSLADFDRKADAVQMSLLPPQVAGEFDTMRTETAAGLAAARELVDGGGRDNVEAMREYQKLFGYNQGFVRVWADLMDDRSLARWIYAHDDVLTLSVAIGTEIQAGQAVLVSVGSAEDDEYYIADVNVEGFSKHIQFTDTAMSTAATSIGYLDEQRDLVDTVTVVPADVQRMRSDLQGVYTALNVDLTAWVSQTDAWQASIAGVDQAILNGALDVAKR